MEDRIEKLERVLSNQTLIDLTMRLDALQQELSQVVGQMEETSHQLQDLKNRQRDLYLDIDRRLQQLEKAGAVPADASAAAANGAADQTSPEARLAYQKALNVLQSGDYTHAVQQFQAYLKKYPNSEYADNAQFWLGDANFVQRRYQEALVEFEKVVRNYPNSTKYADALLKIGLTHVELGNQEQATKTLKELISRFPDTPESRLAEKRLQQISAKSK